MDRKAGPPEERHHRSDIAEHCGFSSRSYFQKVFHKQTGLTPVQYIEQTGGSETDGRTANQAFY